MAAGCNEENCNCPKTDCPRHGKCCQCINNHLRPEQPNMVYCMRVKIGEVTAGDKAK